MIVDTNIIIDVLGPPTVHSEASSEALARAAVASSLSINLIIFAEVSARFLSARDVEERLSSLDLRVAPLTIDIAYRAGTAYRDYRRAGGPKDSILADFFIGAHAEVAGLPIMTRDRKRFETYFPAVKLIDPKKDIHD